MDFNAGEVILLLVFAIIIFGPEKLPDLARKSARVLHYVRRIANDARGQLRQELGPEFADLELSDLNPKAFVAKHVLGSDVTDELNSVAEEVREARNSLDDAVSADDPAVDEAGEFVEPEPVTPYDPEAT